MSPLCSCTVSFELIDFCTNPQELDTRGHGPPPFPLSQRLQRLSHCMWVLKKDVILVTENYPAHKELGGHTSGLSPHSCFFFSHHRPVVKLYTGMLLYGHFIVVKLLHACRGDWPESSNYKSLRLQYWIGTVKNKHVGEKTFFLQTAQAQNTTNNLMKQKGLKQIKSNSPCREIMNILALADSMLFF